MSVAGRVDSAGDGLEIKDSRTGRTYSIPIEKNAIKATDFKKISITGYGSNPVDEVENGLRVIDPGYRNTAVKVSQVTYVYEFPVDGPLVLKELIY